MGYVEGKSIAIDYRYAEGNEKQLPKLAAELVRLKVNVIFTANSAAALAAKNATTAIPIVVALTTDPVATGLVKSLARPGGNVTGLTRLSSSPELTGKQLELLKEAFPRIARVAVFSDPDDVSTAPSFKGIQLAAQALAVQLQSMDVRGPDDFDKAFSAITKKRADALIVLSGVIMNIHQSQIVEFASKRRLPAMYYRPEAVAAGGVSCIMDPTTLTYFAAPPRM